MLREIRVDDLFFCRDGNVETIVEIGVNHFGSIQEGLLLIDLAKAAGAKVVKFQFFNVDNLLPPDEIDWRKRLLEKQLDLGGLETLFNYAKQRGLLPFSTAHDIESFRLMQKVLNPPLFKIGSGEWRNFDYLEEVCSYGKPIILSTGMYSHEDVQETVTRISNLGFDKLILLHCVTAYPVPDKEASLKAITEIRDYFPGIVGYSDHTRGNLACLCAVAMGATVIEKHFTHRINVPNAQDWKASATFEELKTLISDIGRVSAFVDSEAKPSKIEFESRQWATKSLAYATDLPAGTVLSESSFVAVRPGTGLRLEEKKRLVGSVLRHSVSERHLVRIEDIL